VIDQRPRVVFIALVFVFTKDGYEGLGERAFGKHAAQQIGQLEGDEKYVGGQPGPEGAGNHEVPGEAENSGEEGHTTDRGQRAQQIHSVSVLSEKGREASSLHAVF